MTDTNEPQLKSIRDLPSLSDLIGRSEVCGFPEEFSQLFDSKDTHLLRDGAGVAVFRNKDILNVAANPAAGNTPAESILSTVLQIQDAGVNHLPGALQRFYRNLVFTTN